MVEELNSDINLEEIELDLDQLDDSNNQEIEDPRITDIINECVKIKLTYDENKINKEAKKDIEIDFATLLNIKNPELRRQLSLVKDVNIKRRKVNGKKFYFFVKDFKIILSYMNEEELKQLLAMRLLCENWYKYSQSKCNSILDGILLTFANFCNRFIETIDPIAYTPKTKTMEDKNLQELFFSEEHLRYLVKIIILSKITLLFTDNIDKDRKVKDKRMHAKKEIANKIWNVAFVPEDKDINIKNKLHKLISSRFISTEYNEKRFWNVAKYANITITTQENILYNDLKTDSILMLEFDKNPLSFLDVYLKNIIFYISKRKFALEFVLNNFDVQLNNMMSDISTEFKFTILEDNLMNMTVDKFIKTEVAKCINNQHITKTFEENFKKNILHFWIVVPYISKLLRISPMFLTSLHKDKFMKLVIYVYYKLINMKCFIMAELIKSNMLENTTGTYNENVKQNSQLLSRYLKSEDLNRYVDSKSFNNNIKEVEKLIINPIITMSLNKYKDTDGNIISFSTNDLISEYVKFLDNYEKL